MNKKKIILGATTLVIAIFIVGCSNGSNHANSSYTSTVNTKKQEIKIDTFKQTVDTSNQTVDGLTLSVNAKIGVVKGDRTKDNVAHDNGEYIANGSDIVKAADYKSIIVDIDIKNDRDNAADLRYLNGALQDGYKTNSTITVDGYNIQIQAKTSGKYEFKFLVRKDIITENLNLYYLWIKNKDEYQKLIQNASMMNPTIHYMAKDNRDIFEYIRLSCYINN
ncbi:hypothetical protein [Candidatus Clostridium radicumherbarum]|uniref:Lipoprotein n=1 Tax=Candidatus Clostridium radicumherbarum TaxID=3381662 RepID=A0ABW8TS24_9CLOT